MGELDAMMRKPTSSTPLTTFFICWLTVARATWCCAMPRSWFDFQIFIRVSNQIFLEFFVRVSSRSSTKPFDYQGSTVLLKRKWNFSCKWINN